MAERTRTEGAVEKLDRMNKALRHEEPDRVPISDFFWGGFVRRWREELNLPETAEPYSYYDLDWIVTTPNMDPHIKPFEILRETDQEVVVKTGYETTLRKSFQMPMPEQVSWKRSSSTIPAIRGDSFPAATIRLPGLAMDSPATCRPGSRRSRSCAATFRSTAA
jgi:hypothetical protein